MESIHDHSLNDVDKCNKDCGEIGSIYSDSAVPPCKEIKSYSHSKELKLNDKSNGNISINCKLANSRDSVSNLFIKNETLIAEEKNSIGKCERRESPPAQEDFGDNSSNYGEQNDLILTEHSQVLSCNSTPMEILSMEKDEGYTLNNIDLENNLIELPSSLAARIEDDDENKTKIYIKSDHPSLHFCSSEVISDIVNRRVVVESPTYVQSNSENCASNLLLPTRFMNDSQTIAVAVNNVVPKDGEERSMVEPNFLDVDHANIKKDDSMLTKSSCTNTTTYLVENCIVTAEEHLSGLDGVPEEQNTDKDTDTQCCMQRVVEGTLQPLNIHSLGNEEHKDESLFVGVPHEIGVGVEDKIGLILPEPTGIVASYNENNIELIDLTEPPPVHLDPEEETSVPDTSSKAAEVDEEKDKKGSQLSEGKPSLLKVMPIKNGHGLWNIEELRLLLEDRGSVLLRLCAAPEAGNEDIIEGPKADFTALLLEDTFHIPEPETDLSESIGLQNSLVERLSETAYEQFSHIWREPRVQSTPKRKCLPPPFSPPSFFFGPQLPPGAPPRGRKRGRPPLHNRPWMPKSKAAPPPINRYFDDPIKYRPPTPPTSHLPPERRAMGILEAALARGRGDPDPRISCASLSSVKRPAPGSLLSRRLMLARQEITQAEDDSVSATSDEPCKPGRRPAPFVCARCPLRFRKKAALVAHTKLRHKQARECPLCHERVQARGKDGLKLHMARAHPHEKGFRCEACGDAFRLLHHLKNHWKLVHESALSSAEEEEEKSEDGRKRRKEQEEEDAKRQGEEEDAKRKGEEEEGGEETPRKKAKVKSDEKDSASAAPRNRPKMKLRSQAAAPTAVSEEEEELEGGEEARKGKRMEEEEADEEEEAAEKVSSSDGNESDDEGEESDSSSALEEEKQRYFCDVCSAGFSHVFKLRHHKKRHVKGVSSHSPAREETSILAKGLGELRVQLERRSGGLRCGVCGKESRNEYQFRLHTLRHAAPTLPPPEAPKTGGKSNKGATAGIPFAKPDKKRPSGPEKALPPTQEEEGGSGERPSYIVRKGRGFECVRCNLNFRREKQTTYHLKKIHETLYPFRRCPHCTRVFRSCGPFTRHLREHSGRRCPVDGCKAKYKVLRLIKKHQRHAHPQLPHRCQRCVQLFAEEAQLERHTDEVHRRAAWKRKEGQEDEEDDEEEEEEEEEEEKRKKGETVKAKSNRKKTKKEDKRPRREKPNHIVRRAPSKRRTEEEENEEGEEVSSAARRACARSNISYKEDEEEEEEKDLSLQRSVVFSHTKKTPSKLSPALTPPAAKLATRPAAPPFLSQSNPLKNLREALMIQTKAKQKAQAAMAPARPKRQYIRRAPYKRRKVDNSWTAALKAQYEGFDSNAVGKPLKGGYKSPANPQPSASMSMYSPAITADVVRRVAESLLSRHQEQQQKKLQSKRRHLTPSFISYGANSSRLPRIAYSTLAAAASSRDSSLSSFDDSSHAADHSDFYCPSAVVGPAPSAIYRKKNNKVPDDDDDDDSGPAKVLRFDNF